MSVSEKATPVRGKPGTYAVPRWAYRFVPRRDPGALEIARREGFSVSDLQISFYRDRVRFARRQATTRHEMPDPVWGEFDAKVMRQVLPSSDATLLLEKALPPLVLKVTETREGSFYDP